MSDQLFNRIFPLGISQVVTKATRVSPSGELSGLDHLYTNKPDKVSSVNVEKFGNSDHFLLKFSRFTKSEIRTPKFITKRSFKEFDATSFKNEIDNVS